MTSWNFRLGWLLIVVIFFIGSGVASDSVLHQADFLQCKDFDLMSSFNDVAHAFASTLIPRIFEDSLVKVPSIRPVELPSGLDVKFVALSQLAPVREKYHVDMVVNFGFGDSGNPLLALTYKF